MSPRPERILIALAISFAPAGTASASSFPVVITPQWNWTSAYSIANETTIESTINTAISIYETNLTTAVAPINVVVTFGDTSADLGTTTWTPVSVSYNTFVTALTSHAMSADDATALSHLPTGTTSPVTNTSGQTTTNLFMKPANMLALGISFGVNGPPGNDATIGLETSAMNLSRSGAQDPAKYDLQSVAMHEIDEALGLGSSWGVGLPDPSPEDLFRYTGTGGSNSRCSTVSGRSFTSSSSAISCFSINGTSGLAQFNQSSSGDYGDWISSSTVRVQDAFATPGTQPNLSTAEWTALDAIGYNLAVVATPEPGTSLLFVSAIGLIGWRRRSL